MGPGQVRGGFSRGLFDPEGPFFPLFFFIPLGLLLFAPCLFLGQAYFDGDLLAQYVPMRVFLKSSMVEGHPPLWCPYVLGGQPFFADPNTQSAYPLTYGVLPFSAPMGFSILFCLHFVLVAWGMAFWTGTLGLGPRARVLSGVLTALGGFFWWEIIHPPLLCAFAWTPWFLGCLERLSQRLVPSWAFRAGLAFAMLFLSGNYQMTLVALYGGGAYLLFRLLTRRDWRQDPRSDRNLLLSILFLAWGALPLLLLWVPSWEFLQHTDRFRQGGDYKDFQADYSLAPRDLTGLLFPVRSFDGAGQARPIADYLVNAGYLGPWALFLAVLALRKRDRFLWFLGALGAAALLTSLGKFFPLHRLLCRLAPGFDLMRAPFRYLFFYLLVVAVLAAFGSGELEKGLGRKWKWGAVAFGATLLGLGFLGGKGDWPGILSALLGLSGFSLLKEKGRSPLWVEALIGAALVLPVLPTPWLWSSSRSGPASNFDYLGKAPILSELRDKAGLGRVLIGDRIPYPVRSGGRDFVTELPPDSAYVARVRDAIGYNPLGLREIADLYSYSLATNMELRAVRCYAAGDPKWRIKGFRQVERDGLILGDREEKVLFVYAPQRVVSLPEPLERSAWMAGKDFDPYRTGVLSGPFPEGAQSSSASLVSSSLENEGPDRQQFKVRTTGTGLVVFSESAFPGWKAWVDGTPSPILTANHAFRGLWLGPGDHSVVFRYEPGWVAPLLAGSVLWVLSLGLWLLPAWRRRSGGGDG